MAPIKFEEQAREQLEKRQISPSANSWNKLEERLNSVEEKNNAYSKWWMGIAAAVIAALVVAGFVFTSEDITDTPTIVEQPVEEDFSGGVDEKLKPEEEIASEEVEAEPIFKDSSGQKTNYSKSGLKSENTIAKNQNLASVESGENLEDETASEAVPIQNKPQEALFKSKLEEVIAAVNSAEKENGAISDKEVNALLEEAAREISLTSEAKKYTGVVDANMLLQDVEDELDESFRQKVFEMLKEGVIKARTAVVTRNN